MNERGFVEIRPLVEIDGWGGSWIKVQAEGFDEVPEMDIPEVEPIANFLSSIKGEAEPAAGTRNGINHSLLMDAIYASAEKGQPINTADL